MKKMMPFIFIAAGIMLVLVGISLRYKYNTNEEEITIQSKVDTAVEVVATSIAQNGNVTNTRVNNSVADRQTKIVSYTTTYSDQNSSTTSTPQLNQEKGTEFEKFVVLKFNKRYFNLKEWQGDKYHEGYYAENNKNPDFVIDFNLHDIHNTFAVECKWRSNTNRERFDWCTPQQLEHYNNYSKEKNYKVFVVIGLGGEPGEPEEVYIVPLNRMRYSSVTKEYLKQFKRQNANKDFYYKPEYELLQ